MAIIICCVYAHVCVMRVVVFRMVPPDQSFLQCASIGYPCESQLSTEEGGAGNSQKSVYKASVRLTVCTVH